MDIGWIVALGYNVYVELLLLLGRVVSDRFDNTIFDLIQKNNKIWFKIKK